MLGRAIYSYKIAFPRPTGNSIGDFLCVSTALEVLLIAVPFGITASRLQWSDQAGFTVWSSLARVRFHGAGEVGWTTPGRRSCFGHG